MPSIEDPRTRAELADEVAKLRAELLVLRTSSGRSGCVPADAPLGTIRAITDRKGTEQRENETEHLVHKILAATPAIVCVYDFSERRIVYANAQLTQVLGYTTSELQTFSTDWLAGIVGSNDISAVTKGIAELGESGDEWPDAEFRVRHANGEWRWLRARHAVFARDASGKVLQILGYAEDITERWASEHDLPEGEAWFRRVFDQSPIGMAIVSIDEQACLRANRALTRFLGYAEEDLVGKRFRDITHPDDLATTVELIARLASGEVDQHSVERRLVRQDGVVVWGRVSTCVVRDARGEPVCFLPMFEDIDGKRRAEQALKVKAEELEGFFALSLDLLCIWDSRGIFQRINSAWENTLGVSTSELIGARMADWVHPDDVALTEAVRVSLVREGQVAAFTNRLRCRDGSHRSFEWHATCTEQQVLYAVGRDITERIQREEERTRLAERLGQAQRLESVGRLAGGVAHDFNNLLTCVSGNLSLVLLDMDERNPLHEILTEVSGAADSAARLTRQLLSFSRRQFVAPTVIGLNDLVERTEQMLVRLIGEDIELTSNLQPSLGNVKVDAGQIEQALVNLAMNARDAMPDGGSLVIQTADVALGARYETDHADVPPGEYVMLEVSDTGVGMSDEAKQHLFEPFFTTKQKSRGTGLGLATVYGAVKQAGGSIEVNSELGRGTTFRIYLPRVPDRPETPDIAVPPVWVPSGAETVLLVEDELIVLRFAERSLCRLGYTVLACPTPNEALAVAADYKERIDILVTDVVMPGMNGRVLADHIKQVRPEIQVLFASGYTENVIGHHGVMESGLAFLAKPYTTQALAAKIQEVLSKQSMRG